MLDVNRYDSTLGIGTKGIQFVGRITYRSIRSGTHFEKIVFENPYDEFGFKITLSLNKILLIRWTDLVSKHTLKIFIL